MADIFLLDLTSITSDQQLGYIISFLMIQLHTLNKMSLVGDDSLMPTAMFNLRYILVKVHYILVKVHFIIKTSLNQN